MPIGLCGPLIFALQLLHRRMKKNQWMYFALGLLLVGRIVLGSALEGELLNYDDERYIASNALIDTLDGAHVGRMFTEYFDGHYHPLSLLSLAIDRAISDNPIRAHHQTSLWLHLFNAVFVFLLLLRLGLDRMLAFSVALLWMLHPMQPESFAWMTERKNVLYTFFFLASASAYTTYLKGQKWLWLLAAYALAILSLLSKAQAVALLPVFVMLDVLKSRDLRQKSVWLEKLPLFLVFGLFVWVTAQAQSAQWQALSAPDTLGAQRPLLAAYAFLLYVLKGLVPIGLSAYYPYPSDCGGSGQALVWLGIPAFIGFAVLIFWSFRTQRLLTAFGLGFFWINLLPVLKFGSIPFGDYLMADRYAYIPLVGLLLAVLNELKPLVEARSSPRVFSGGIAVLAILFSISTQARIQTWSSSEALWSEVLARCPDYFHALNMRALGRVASGDAEGAVDDWESLIEKQPDRVEARVNLAVLFSKQSNPEAALRVLEAGIQSRDPKQASEETDRLFNTAAALYARTGNRSRALELLESLGPERADSTLFTALKAQSAQSENPEDSTNLGSIEQRKSAEKASALSSRATDLAKQGRHKEANRLFSEALKNDSSNARIWLNRGSNWAQAGDLEAALRDFDQSVRLDPNLGLAHLMRATALRQKGARAEACAAFAQAARLGVSLPPDIRSYCSSTDANRAP